MKVNDFIKWTSGLFMLIGSVSGGYIYLDGRYALADTVQQLEVRVSLNELLTLRNRALEYVYFLRDQHRRYPEDVQLKDKLVEAEKELKDIDIQIAQLKGTHVPPVPSE